MPHSSCVATPDLEGQRKESAGAKVKQSGWGVRRRGGSRGEQGRAASKRTVTGVQKLSVCATARVSPDLESDGVVGEVEMMKGPRGRWVKMIKQSPANQTYYSHKTRRLSL